VVRLTLDHNCIINLENRTGQHAAIEKLIALHRSGAAWVALGVISASENVRSGRPSYAAFVERIANLGLSDLPQILPEARVDMAYIGLSTYAGDDGLDRKVRDIIHPSFENYEVAMKANFTHSIGRKQRNALCDVDAVVAHIRHDHDVFVTEDRHFLDRRVQLAPLGVRHVLTPEETLRHVQAGV
jgi:hypothetical protein